MRSRARWQVPLATFFLAVLASGTARADLWGADMGPLSTLVAQGAHQAVEFAQALKTARETYEETRKYVGMAQDAVDTFNEFRAFGQTALKQPEQLFTQAFPELGYFQAELSSPEKWGRGTGELQRQVRLCLSGGGQCREFHEAVRAKQARLAISATFGTAPAGADDAEVLDTEAALAVSASTHEMGRASVTQQQARALMEKCLRGTSQSSIAACQAAAYAADILQAEQLAVLNQQAAAATRLQAVELAAQSAERKRQLREADERRRAVEAGARLLAPVQFRQKNDGFQLFEEK